MARKGRGSGVKVDIKGMKRLTDLEKRLVAPLLDVAKSLRDAMKIRIKHGIDAKGGAFSPLGAFSEDKPGGGLWWVPPSKPQPGGWIQEGKQAKWQGWKGYASYLDYTRRVGDRRTFYKTGGLLESLAIMVRGVNQVKLYFQGSRSSVAQDGTTRRTNYRDIAWFNSFREDWALLTPSAAEAQEALQIVEDATARQILGTAAKYRQAQNSLKKAEGLQRRVSAMSRGR